MFHVKNESSQLIRLFSCKVSTTNSVTLATFMGNTPERIITNLQICIGNSSEMDLSVCSRGHRDSYVQVVRTWRTTVSSLILQLKRRTPLPLHIHFSLLLLKIWLVLDSTKKCRNQSKESFDAGIYFLEGRRP